MLNKIIEFSLKNRLAVVLVFAAAAGLGLRALFLISVDAFPDLTPVHVQINTVAPALNPAEVERQITMPVELSVSGLPGLRNVRSISKFGLSQVVATFDDDIAVYDARQFIMERLTGVELPEGIERPQMGPITSGLGEVFHYLVRSKNPNRTLDELRTLHDWVVKPELLKVAGVAEVNSWGGYERQYHVIVSPTALVKYGVTMQDVFEALEQNNRNVGGGLVVASGQALLVHGLGRVATVEQIGNIVLKAHAGVPIRIKDVAEVAIGHEIRRGAVTAGGQGEVVLGLGFMLLGGNSKQVTEALKARLEAVRASLPPDVVLETVYDRTELVKKVIQTVTHNLTAGAVLVVLVLFALLGSFRSGLLVAVAIPLSMLFAALGMYQFAIAATLLSLGAIDFGILVDGSVVMTDNNMRRLVEKQREAGRPLTAAERLQSVIASSEEVARPTLFGMGIILLVFLPILTLEGVEGKMFRPMAWTFIFALIGALIAAVMLTPVLSYYFLPSRLKEKEGIGERLLGWIYRPVLAAALRLRWGLIAAVLALLVLTGYVAQRLGGEFVPRLSEEAIVINIVRLAGVSIEESVAYNGRIEAALLKAFPDEIKHIWTRIGTAEVATDPMGTELSDIFIALHPRERWKRGKTQADLVRGMEDVVRDLPGLRTAFTQPIEMRYNELASGIRSDVGIKIYGDDFDELIRLGGEVQRVLYDIRGAADLSAEQITGQPVLQIAVKQDQIARYGIPARHVLDLIEAVGSRRVGDIVEGQRRFPLAVRLPEKQRTDADALADTIIPTQGGPLLPLRWLADVKETEGPATINREWGRRFLKVECNVRGRDVASFVKEARSRIAAEVQVPEGYLIEWGGQFEHLERSKLRLMIVVPLTLGLIFIFLFFSLNSLTDALVVYTGIPFAAVGGVFSLWLRGIPFSVSAAVGFIALSGIAVLNGQLLVSTIRTFRARGAPLHQAVMGAAQQRLRPVLATAITDAAGFIPMALSTGVGAEVQRPLATVVIGGLVTSTVLTLLVLPVIYTWKKGRPAE